MNVSGREKGKGQDLRHEGPECFRNNKETSMARVRQGASVGHEAQEATRQGGVRGPCTHARALAFSV